MTRVASYYASVGIDFDVKTLSQVSGYLKRIERMLDGFRSRIQKSSNIGLRIRIDKTAAAKTLNMDLKNLAKNMTITLSKFNVNGSALTKAVNSAFSSSRGQIRVGTILSQASLSGMRNQIRNSLSNITISPRINPRTANGGRSGGGTGGYGSGPNSFTGTHHNPMFLGGGAGAVMRYGAYALPFVAGAYGLNSLGNMAQELQSNRIVLGGVAQGTSGGKDGEYYSNYISSLGDRLGMTTRSLTPSFTQMLAASRGTKLEGSLEGNFGTFMEYAAGMGLNEEKQKRSLYAITQMIGKGKMGAEEVRQQLGDVMPTFLPMLAKAVTGGNSEEDIAKLDDMMKKGKVYTATYLPKVMAIMQQEASGMMPGYYSSINYKRGNTERMKERYAIDLMAGGGESAVAGFWETLGNILERSSFSAKSMGKGLEVGSNLLQGAMLVGPEFLEYFNGKAMAGNLFTAMMGAADKNPLIPAVNELKSSLDSVASALVNQFLPSIISWTQNALSGGLGERLRTTGAHMLELPTGIYNSIGNVLSGKYNLGDVVGSFIPGAGSIMNRPGGVMNPLQGPPPPSREESMQMERNAAANRVAGGTGVLDQYSNRVGNVSVTNNITLTVDSAQSAEKMKQVIDESAKKSYSDAFKGQMSVVPKIPQ
jgi:tape measure domain-containing protein